VKAHVRKAYPRDQEPEFEGRDSAGDPIARGPFAPGEAESKTQTHRLLRRGIPFGKSFGVAIGGGAEEPRGLLFLAYQSDIERHFEFVQGTWVNDPDFARGGAGRIQSSPITRRAARLLVAPFIRGLTHPNARSNFDISSKRAEAGGFP
jgi:deferrochelatase/peroxidase EfeB